MEYHKTKDILHVKKLLGHKNIQNTLVYTHLINFESEEFVCKVAKTLEECIQLLEAGLGTAYEGYERTIDAHIKNLRAKIERDTKNPHYIETVFGVGYCFAKL